MATPRNSRVLWTIPVLTVICLSSFPAYAKYSGGTGDPNDPYQIATAEDLILLGETPEDYDKHFILTADIDMDPKLPGRKVFDKAVIAPGTFYSGSSIPFRGTPFTGVFDGKGHTIAHLTIVAKDFVALFGQLQSGAEVRNLGGLDVHISGSGEYVGAMVGRNEGTISQCYSTGSVNGSGEDSRVGGLVGYNGVGTVAQCYSIAKVTSSNVVGGLVGWNQRGRIVSCYSGGTISGTSFVGMLVGGNNGSITSSYSSATVSGETSAGGLTGGSSPDRVKHSVWDTETSGVLSSSAGVGLTTTEMMDTYMLALNGFANDPNWVLDAGHDYPRLAWEQTPGDIIPEPDINWMEGKGTKEAPYRIDTSSQLILLGRASMLWHKHLTLGADIDLDPNLPGRQVFQTAVIQTFSGVLDGNNHKISHLTIKGAGSLGLFGCIESGAEVRDLDVVDVNIAGSSNVGALAGDNIGTVTNSRSSGRVGGESYTGGLVGWNRYGRIVSCYSTGMVTGGSTVGGLVGRNSGHIIHCHSASGVTGNGDVGGLVGWQYGGSVTSCYNTGSVNGSSNVGGLVGENNGTCDDCYSVGTVTGSQNVGGLVGRAGTGAWLRDSIGIVTECFWDTQSSGQATSDGGTGKTTAEMQTASTFLEAGWDFVGETANGPNDVWKIVEGQTYPLLSWQKYGGGTGEPNDPYLIYTAEHLNELGAEPNDYDKHFKLMADVDLSGYKYDRAVIAPDVNEGENFFQGTAFTGVFDGDGHAISHLTIEGGGYLGLFGITVLGANISNLGLEAVDVNGTGGGVGGLVGNNGGRIANSYSTGEVSGTLFVGGLVGVNARHWGSISTSYSTGEVIATGQYASVGGLVGANGGGIANSFSTGAVIATGQYASVGGLVGTGGAGFVTSFWDIETSGQTNSAVGTGKTTTEMQTASTFLEAGWDFIDETANGTEDIWWILEGQDYPRLWWERK